MINLKVFLKNSLKKTKIKSKNLKYIYHERSINENLTIEEIIDEDDKLNLKMTIKVIKEKAPKGKNDLLKKNNACNELHLTYLVKEDDEKRGKIKVFGKDFVKNNSNILKIIYKKKEYDLTEEFDIENTKTYSLKIKLKGIINITNLSCMFYECNNLLSIPNISNWNTIKVIDMSFLFYNCYLLESLPDISKWNTSNVKDMSFMFYGCSSLTSLPNISNWNTKSVINMRAMFGYCSSLTSFARYFQMEY